MSKFLFRFKNTSSGVRCVLWVIDGERRYSFFGGPVTYGKTIGDSIDFMCKRNSKYFKVENE